jgi:hypothetical protein
VSARKCVKQRQVRWASPRAVIILGDQPERLHRWCDLLLAPLAFRWFAQYDRETQGLMSNCPTPIVMVSGCLASAIFIARRLAADLRPGPRLELDHHQRQRRLPNAKLAIYRKDTHQLARLRSDQMVDFRYDSGSFSHGRRDALGGARPHIADGEDTGPAGLKR